MKNIKKLTGVLLALSLMSCAPSPALAFGTELRDPDAAYELDTFGSNSEIYEYTPKAAPFMTCSMFMLDSGNAMSIDCYPKLEYLLFIEHPDKFPDPRTGKISIK